MEKIFTAVSQDEELTTDSTTYQGGCIMLSNLNPKITLTCTPMYGLLILF